MEADCWQRTTGWRRFEFGRLDPGGAMSEDLCVSEQAHSSHARTVVEDELPWVACIVVAVLQYGSRLRTNQRQIDGAAHSRRRAGPIRL
jgi:hypothetical protein